ncbi:MAG: PSD1 and planctomycete cytochrome C domain-containing protein [Verrucomicrobiota bacterium]
MRIATLPATWVSLFFSVVWIELFPLEAASSSIDFSRDVQPILSDNCYACHGPDSAKRKAGLRLDDPDSAKKVLKSGTRAIVPGDPVRSSLIERITSKDADELMPPEESGKTLTPAQVDVLRRWIKEGAPWKKHWAFVPPESPAVPRVQLKRWPRNPIDHFILARLEQEKLRPSNEADRATLIRRVTLDLTGLPPSVEEVNAFLADRRPDAYEQLVERLLSSPHYGERWGRHWLDSARYADSNGYSIDAPRSIWKYRDWVIDALNHDLPFDQFTIWQLAGDLLPQPTLEQRIATGFHRNTQINEEGGIDKEQFRIESVLDRVNTTGTVWLGLTVGCAQCHDHKYDPLSQKEYFQLFAFLNNADEPNLEIPGEYSGQEDLEKQIAELEEDIDRYINAANGDQKTWEQQLTEEAKSKLKSEVRQALEVSFDRRTLAQKAALYSAFRPDDADFKKRQQRLAALRKKEPKPVTTMVMAERAEPRESYVFIKGDFTRKGDPVIPEVPAVLHPLPKEGQRNRLDLARWLVDPRNPLTPRVIVNRIWMRYFGRGLVETENDFGSQGALPTHPELLDWLATEFIRQNWSMKAMHRLIVTSSTYRQASKSRPELQNIDPYNKLLARQNRLRLDAEVVRDVALTASGLLTAKIGGPSVFPPQPDGVMTLGQSRRDWKPHAGADRYRRGLYTFFWRATPHPALTVFDAPDAFSACTRRIRSNTPLQALTLLNDAAFFECAEALTARVLREGPSDDAARVDYAFRLCLGRAPSVAEKQRLLQLIQEQIQAGDSRQIAWQTASRVLLNLDETITRE